MSLSYAGTYRPMTTPDADAGTCPARDAIVALIVSAAESIGAYMDMGAIAAERAQRERFAWTLQALRAVDATRYTATHNRDGSASTVDTWADNVPVETFRDGRLAGDNQNDAVEFAAEQNRAFAADDEAAIRHAVAVYLGTV